MSPINKKTTMKWIIISLALITGIGLLGAWQQQISKKEEHQKYLRAVYMRSCMQIVGKPYKECEQDWWVYADLNGHIR
jgi:hypothetical protein